MIIRVCNKCKKEISPKELWEGNRTYKIRNNRIVKLNKQKVIFEGELYLECGDALDLHDDCAWAIIRTKVSRKERRNDLS